MMERRRDPKKMAGRPQSVVESFALLHYSA
jgi:hypothetical protein